jgi:hypothetical protein
MEAVRLAKYWSHLRQDSRLRLCIESASASSGEPPRTVPGVIPNSRLICSLQDIDIRGRPPIRRRSFVAAVPIGVVAPRVRAQTSAAPKSADAPTPDAAAPPLGLQAAGASRYERPDVHADDRPLERGLHAILSDPKIAQVAGLAGSGRSPQALSLETVRVRSPQASFADLAQF